MVQVKPCGYHHVVKSFSGVLLSTSRLDKSQGGLAESLKANAAAADLTMQQLPGTLPLCMLFSTRFILGYYAVARSARQSRD